MSWSYDSYAKVGSLCHWCGKLVPKVGAAKTGKHLFCRNGGKCKMAHHRAFSRWLKNGGGAVTEKTRSSGLACSTSGPGGNADRGAPCATSSPAIRKIDRKSGNKRKGGK